MLWWKYKYLYTSPAFVIHRKPNGLTTCLWPDTQQGFQCRIAWNWAILEVWGDIGWTYVEVLFFLECTFARHYSFLDDWSCHLCRSLMYCILTSPSIKQLGWKRQRRALVSLINWIWNSIPNYWYPAELYFITLTQSVWTSSLPGHMQWNFWKSHGILTKIGKGHGKVMEFFN